MLYPGLIIDFYNIGCVPFQFGLFKVFKGISRVCRNELGLVFQPAAQWLVYLLEKCVLLVIGLKPVVFKKPLVIRKVIVALVVRLQIEPFDKQSPPLITPPKINWAVHIGCPLGGKPLPGSIEKQVGRLLVIDAFKKPYPTGKLTFRTIPLVFRYKGCDPSNGTVLIFEEPAPAVTLVKRFVDPGIKYRPDIRVQGADPCPVVPVEKNRKIDKFLFIGPGGHRYKMHRVCC